MRHTEGGSLKSASGFLRLLRTWTLGTELAHIIRTCKIASFHGQQKRALVCRENANQTKRGRKSRVETVKWWWLYEKRVNKAWARSKPIGESSSSSNSSSIKQHRWRISSESSLEELMKGKKTSDRNTFKQLSQHQAKRNVVQSFCKWWRYSPSPSQPSGDKIRTRCVG